MTRPQTRAIRDFSITLNQSVSIIAKQSLIALPGSKFAYSGAGYCVLGAVAEKAANGSIEDILQQQLCRPLDLKRTTYFPNPKDANIAAAAAMRNGRTITNPQSPHLCKPALKLPLIGGSIYSTANETAEFARMILNQGKLDQQRLLSQNSWNEISTLQFTGQGYGLGWRLEVHNGSTVAMSHGGALTGYRSLIRVSFKEGFACVVHWTLSNSKSPTSKELPGRLQRASGL